MIRIFGHLVLVVVTCAATMRAETVLPNRPDLSAAKPIATCKLQTIAVDATPEMMPQVVGFYSVQAPPDDPLLNYERTPLGDWYKPAPAERDDPWLRFVLLAPSRPVVVDMAVFIDGKPFRNAREAWIDDVFAAAKPIAEGGADVEPEAEGNKTSAQEGTNTTSDASKDAEPSAQKSSPETKSEIDATADSNLKAKAESKTDSDKDQKDETPAIPGVKAQGRQAPQMRDRLINYLTASGAKVDREEIEWLIAESGSGPAIILLGASQTWQRAGMAPLMTYLDQDSDGALSADEITNADALLRRADFDGNDVVEVSEIRRATKHAAAASSEPGHSLVALIDANTDWDSLDANLARMYESKADVARASREFSISPADITMRVDFAAGDAKDKSGATLSAISVSPNIAADDKAVNMAENVISMDIGGDYVEFSAAQAGAEQMSDIRSSQVAIGAVIDGSPLLRLLDRDQDARLTMRECQELPALLAAIDRDKDGSISAAEVPVPIRLAVTLGPQVHQLLATPTGAARMIAASDTPKAPDWFASMDKNNDGDLSRGEFLGTSDQFRQFDENGDKLLGVAEALKLNPGE